MIGCKKCFTGILFIYKDYQLVFTGLSKQEMDVLLTKYDIKRLEMYCNNLVDYHLVVDLLPTLARLYFLNKMGDIHLSAVQAVSINIGELFNHLIWWERFNHLFW